MDLDFFKNLSYLADWCLRVCFGLSCSFMTRCRDAQSSHQDGYGEENSDVLFCRSVHVFEGSETSAPLSPLCFCPVRTVSAAGRPVCRCARPHGGECDVSMTSLCISRGKWGRRSGRAPSVQSSAPVVLIATREDGDAEPPTRQSMFLPGDVREDQSVNSSSHPWFINS